MERRTSIIIAPHADDELIGCYSVLLTGTVGNVFYGSEAAIEEAKACAAHFNFGRLLAEQALPESVGMGYTFYFPDPAYELHPLHRYLGAIGEDMLRNGEDVIFYTTNMNAPYMHVVNAPEVKKGLLDSAYFEKRDLWKYDHKYFLFEGHCKWLI